MFIFAGIGFSLLYLGLVSIVWRGSKTIDRQQVRINATNEELNGLNTALTASIVKLKVSQSQLYQSAKLAGIGELVSGVAHELNNPLAAILMYAELLREEVKDEGAIKHIEVLQKQTERATGIISNLLSFAHKHEPKKTRASINAAVTNSVELRTYEMSLNNTTISLDLDEALPETMVDSHQLQQVFLNLITNAEQAMVEVNGKGTISIRTRTLDGMILTTFSDDGPGIPADKLDRIFDPFFTTKDIGKGTGLGLSICYGIIKEHGGHIYVESVERKGATFTVELPVISGPVGLPSLLPENDEEL